MSSQRSLAASMASERDAIAHQSGRILTAKYLEKATSKKDLAKRLRTILCCLRDDEDVEPDNPQDYPGLAALCQSLTQFVNHRDKEIRLYTVAACMELFTIYAPEAPWNELETLDIFKQTIRQLANLGHNIRPMSSSSNSSGSGNSSSGSVVQSNTSGATTNSVHFYQYYRILELLAEVKIAVLLVDLSKKNDDDHNEDGGAEEEDVSSHNSNSSDDSSTSNDSEEVSLSRRTSPRRRSTRNSSSGSGTPTTTIAKKKTTKTTKTKAKDNINKEALQVLSELFRTLLQSVRNEHPAEVFDFCQKTLTSCVEEFFESTILPVPILDELLVCIGQGPRVLVLQQQQAAKSSSRNDDSDKRPKRGRKRAAKGATPPAVVTVQQNNPSYMVASAVVRASVERLSTPIATLLNGLVNSDPRSIGQSTISNHVCDDSNSNTTSQEQRNRKESGIPEEVMEMVHNLGKAQRQQQDVHGTSNVYGVILELHRVAPAILTTVFGNLASHVETPDVAHRILVVQTLGKLFAGNQSSSGSSNKSGGSDKANGNLQVAYQYNPCFRKWLQRSGDRRLEIRRIMVPHVLSLTRAGSSFLNGTASASDASSPQAELARDVQEALIQRLTHEPSAKFRTEVVQGLCTLSYQHRKILSRRVMDQLGERVMSKDKSERKDALTGLVQLHFRQYTRHHLATVLEGGDDCPIESVLQVFDECCPPPSTSTVSNGLTSLIAARSKASLSSLGTDGSPRKKHKKKGKKGGKRSSSRSRRQSNDSESEESDHDNDESYGSRDLSYPSHGSDDFSYYQWIPCVLFESASYTDATDSDMHSRVVQLVDELLLGCSSPHPENRRQLTSTGRATGLAMIVDAVRNQSPLAWHWMAKLQSVRAKLQKSLKVYLDARADIRNFQTGSEEYFAADAKAKDLLEKVAFMIPQPSGTAPAPGERHSVLEKFHSIKDKHIFRILATITNPSHSAKARARALDDLPKRVKATAGDAVQAWVKSLAKRCAMGDFINHDSIHHCVLLAQECFHEGEFDATLKFLVCIQLAVESFPSLCASEEVFENLSELFRDCNSMTSSSSRKTTEEPAIITALSAILASVSPHRDYGTDSTELEEDLHKKLVALCRNGTPEQARHAVATMASLLMPKYGGALTQEQTDAFLPLLQTLATPSRLSIASTGSSTRLICVLAALTELAEHAPKVFESSTRGTKALKFALEMVLMGRAHVTSNNDDDESDSNSSSGSDDEMEETKTAKRGRTGRKSNGAVSHLSPSAGNQSPLEDGNLSVSCRTLCAAMEFLTTFIRCSVFTAKKIRSVLPQASLDLIGQFFHILSQILRDQGLPPSSRDRKLCNLRPDRAALRQCATINTFRLCDTRLGLDQKHLTTERWHYLASVLLDDERVVRKAVVEELGLMITGHGKFAAVLGMGAMAPRLRFVAMSVFCIDGSQGFHSKANGNAANIGKIVNSQKGNIAGCISFLRKVYESNAAQCRARGPEAEKEFETFTKLTVMPEYAVPYAFHLLACRHETPSSKGLGRRQAGKVIDHEIDETGQKVLRKRLKALYDPLVLQLGVSADNISFLLRMAEMLAKSFQPIGCTSVGLENDNGKKEQDKLTNICATAREVLLSYVKTDANLDTHPGAIRMPGNLFRKKVYRKRSAKALSSTTDNSPILNMMIETENDDVEEKNPGQKATTERSARSTKLIEQKSKNSNDSIMKDDGESNIRMVRRSTRSTMSHDGSESKMSADTDVTSRNDDISDENIESQKNKRKAVRRSTRSTRSTKFEELNDSLMSDSIDAEHEGNSTEKGKKTVESSQSSTDIASDIDYVRGGVLPLSEGKESPSNMRRSEGSNKKRRSEVSEGSLANSRVHFSPEVDFGGLSPINRRASRDYRNDQALLSSSETKTRGTTPPSTLRDTNFTATASVGVGSIRSTDTRDSESPTTVSESTLNHSVGASSSQGQGKLKPLGDQKMELGQSRPKRTTAKFATVDKENTNVHVAKKKKQIPKQIKIVRSKPSPKLKAAKAAQKKTRSKAAKRRRGKKSNPIDSFDFEG